MTCVWASAHNTSIFTFFISTSIFTSHLDFMYFCFSSPLGRCSFCIHVVYLDCTINKNDFLIRKNYLNGTFHIMAVQSLDAEAKYSPLLENCTNQTSFLWSVKICISGKQMPHIHHRLANCEQSKEDVFILNASTIEWHYLKQNKSILHNEYLGKFPLIELHEEIFIDRALSTLTFYQEFKLSDTS